MTAPLPASAVRPSTGWALRLRFACRCALAATLAYLVAQWFGLPHSVWAPISALVVSQEEVEATHRAMIGRFIGTVVGVVLSLAVHAVGQRVGGPLLAQVALSVAICAVLASVWPAIRVSLWTCPLVLVGVGPTVDVDDATMQVNAWLRAAEVLMGSAVGGVLHVAESRLVAVWRR